MRRIVIILKHLTLSISYLLIFLTQAKATGTLLGKANLIYLGAFKVPSQLEGGTSWTTNAFGYGGQLIAFNPAGDGGKGSLFLGGNLQGQTVAEINIPEIVKSNE